MDKKVLKMYEAPEVEIVNVETEGFLCGSTGVPGTDIEEPEEE